MGKRRYPSRSRRKKRTRRLKCNNVKEQATSALSLIAGWCPAKESDVPSTMQPCGYTGEASGTRETRHCTCTWLCLNSPKYRGRIGGRSASSLPVSSALVSRSAAASTAGSRIWRADSRLNQRNACSPSLYTAWSKHRSIWRNEGSVFWKRESALVVLLIADGWSYRSYGSKRCVISPCPGFVEPSDDQRGAALRGR